LEAYRFDIFFIVKLAFHAVSPTFNPDPIIFHAEPSAMGCEEAKGAKFIRISIDKIAGIKS